VIPRAGAATLATDRPAAGREPGRHAGSAWAWWPGWTVQTLESGPPERGRPRVPAKPREP